jgi:hypothetical protein
MDFVHSGSARRLKSEPVSDGQILAFYRLAFDHHDFDHNRRMTKN